MSSFPYGADPLRPKSFLGLSSAPSRRWFVAYVSGVNTGVGAGLGRHQLIFLGLENLILSSITFTGAGTAVGGGARWAGRGKRQQEILQRAEDAVNAYAAEQSAAELLAASAEASSLYHLMMNDTIPQLLSAETPFSLNDIERAWGTLEGFNADIYFTGIQSFKLTMHSHFSYFESEKRYFTEHRLSNNSGGGIGVGYAKLPGRFTIGETFSLYDEGGRSPDPHARPYRMIPMVHPYIAELPPAAADASVPASALAAIPGLSVGASN